MFYRLLSSFDVSLLGGYECYHAQSKHPANLI